MTLSTLLSSLLSLSPHYILPILLLTPLLYLALRAHAAHLSHIPGPFISKYSDAYRAFLGWRWSGSNRNYQRQWTKQYGDVVRIGPKTVLVNDPDSVPVVLGLKGRLDKVGNLVFLR